MEFKDNIEFYEWQLEGGEHPKLSKEEYEIIDTEEMKKSREFMKNIK